MPCGTDMLHIITGFGKLDTHSTYIFSELYHSTEYLTVNEEKTYFFSLFLKIKEICNIYNYVISLRAPMICEYILASGRPILTGSVVETVKKRGKSYKEIKETLWKDRDFSFTDPCMKGKQWKKKTSGKQQGNCIATRCELFLNSHFLS
jgi:hypothetical protein